MSNERDILAYFLVIIPRNIPSLFCVELHWTADDCCRRNSIQVLIAWVSRIRHCNRRGFCGCNSLVREPFDFVLWLLRGRLLRNCLLACGQSRRTLAFCVVLLAGQFLCRGSRCSADFRFHGFSSCVCRMHWVGGCTRMPLSAVVVSRDYVLRFR